jgi:hypothetical protein
MLVFSALVFLHYAPSKKNAKLSKSAKQKVFVQFAAIFRDNVILTFVIGNFLRMQIVLKLYRAKKYVMLKDV